MRLHSKHNYYIIYIKCVTVKCDVFFRMRTLEMVGTATKTEIAGVLHINYNEMPLLHKLLQNISLLLSSTEVIFEDD